MHRWKLSALAAAAICLAGLHAPDASALTLGRVSVQSALGEPLRADIDLPQITPAEAESLRATLATPDVFRAQGLEYSPTLNGVSVALERRSDGSMALRLSSDRPINDPFVDLVIDASWNAGRVVRSYTMLFDPPSLRRPAPAVTAAAQVTAPPAASAAQAARPAPAPQPQPQPRAGTAPAPAPAPAARPQPYAAPAAPRQAASPAPDEVVVRTGDTAGRIASANRPAGVSLDQMLVAMLRANPEAFIRGNVNRVRAGAVLQLPDEAQAQATPPAEARQIIAAQSRDFNEFRRRLAAAAPKAEVAAADRSASGSVQTQVEDRKAATAAPDKLTLSKGGVQASRAEEQLAKDKQAHEASARMAELSKNISDLNKLSAASPAASAASAAAAAPAASASAPQDDGKAQAGLNTSGPQPAASAAAAAASAAADSASAPASAASAAQAPASAPASSPATAAPPADAAEQPSFFSTLMEEPLVPGAALAIILALLGYGGWRAAKRRRAQAADSAFMESRVPPDSFFGASGGERVDTSNGGGANSSLAYSPSQLDAGGDVDPVAEADVYLAYGRDLQAEEILKEAARHHPERVAIPAKLADIYAKRQDRKAFESVARDVLRLTNGQGPDWNRVAEQGRSLDPDNSLYKAGAPASAEASAYPAPDAVAPGAFAGALAGATLAAGLAQAEAPAPAPAAPARADTSDDDLDLDLDLDLSGDALSEAPPAAEPPAAPPPASSFAQAAAAAAGATAEPEIPPAPPSLPDLDLSGFDMPSDPQGGDPASTAADDGRIGPPDFSASDLSMLDDVPGTAPDAAAAPQEPREFDLGDLSLDLDLPDANASAEAAPATEAAAPAADSEAAADDPLATKLALAEEFNAIGDSEGARTLIEEVIAESSGELKARAQRLLADIG